VLFPDTIRVLRGTNIKPRAGEFNSPLSLLKLKPVKGTENTNGRECQKRDKMQKELTYPLTDKSRENVVNNIYLCVSCNSDVQDEFENCNGMLANKYYKGTYRRKDALRLFKKVAKKQAQILAKSESKNLEKFCTYKEIEAAAEWLLREFEFCVNGEDYKHLLLNRYSLKKECVKKIEINAKRWYDEKNANTYHTVKIYVNDRFFHDSGITYGYERQYEQTAKTWLLEKDYIGECFGLWRYCEKNKIEYIDTVKDVENKKDL